MLRAILSITAGMALALLAGSILSRWTSSPSPSDLAASPEPPAREERRHDPAHLDRPPQESSDTPWAEAAVEDAEHGWLHDELADAYRDKLSNPRYVAWRNLPGLPKGYQDSPEEARIKQARSQIARGARPPAGARLIEIPNAPSERPVVDGRFDELEYWRAVEVGAPRAGETDLGTRIYLLCNGESLHLAADVPAEVTADGYDQFRFYFHVGTTPLIVNERIHVGRGRDDVLGGIRQTLVRWTGAPPENEAERWKKYGISDWRIFAAARGLSSLADKGHRQYEARLELHEAGLHVGIPFPSFVEVETDPEKRDGQFVRRRYLGHLGSQQEPVWFVIRN